VAIDLFIPPTGEGDDGAEERWTVLHGMHCVTDIGATWMEDVASHSDGMEIGGRETYGWAEGENHAAQLHPMHCVITATIPVRLASLGAPVGGRARGARRRER